MTVLERLGGMIAATHPIPAASVTVLVTALVAARGAATPAVAWVLASTAAGQASIGWSNDYLDRVEDARAGRRDKPVVAGSVSPSALALAAPVAFAAAVVFSVPLGLPEALVMGIAVASAWAYNLWLKRTAVSWVPYAVSFGLVPVYAWVATDALPPPSLVSVAALLGVAAHLTNVLPDLEADRALGRRGLPHRLGPRTSLFCACALLLAALAVALWGSGAWRSVTLGIALAAVAALLLIAAVFVSVRRGSPRAGFTLTIAAAGAIAAVVILSFREAAA
jgi:4-hydroxybenzoate polyprenyltransferase